MNNYYVYAYLREDGTPYYIGKGKGKRAWDKINRNVYPKPDLSNIVICENNLTNIGALALERRLIRWHGRIDQGTGILRNKTNGGDGNDGWIPSQETRDRISETNSGKLKGVTFAERFGEAKAKEVSQKMSDALKHKEKTYLKGKTYEEIYGEKRALELKEIRSRRKGHKVINFTKPQKIECSHCNKLFDPGNLKRHLQRITAKEEANV